MNYLIDGYNLLHHVGRLQPGRGNLEAARLDLLRLLHGKFAEQPNTITVVFDAQKAPARIKVQEDYHGIVIRFTRSEEADDLIEDLIHDSTAPAQLTVVSNDRRIKDAARRKGCPVLECVTFWELLLSKPSAPSEPPTPLPERPAFNSDDVDHWVQEFGHLEQQADFKELFGPDFED